jgi:predicted permease
MNLIRNIGAGVAALFRRRRVEAELDEELEGYLEASAADKRRLGMSAEMARLAARREMGSREVVKHKVWGSRWEATVDGVLQDLRLSLRGLLKSPGFTLVALLSLALGIGANTAIFTLIEQVLLRELPVSHPEQLVTLTQASGGGVAGGIDLGDFGLFPRYFMQQLEGNPGPFQGIGSFASFAPKASVRVPDAPSTAAPAIVPVGMVSGNYFAVLGARPLLGRTIVPAEDATPGAGAVAVVSYHFWQQKLSASAGVLGKTVSLNGTPFTIIGVMPPDFHGLKQDQDQAEMWAPLSMQTAINLEPSFLGREGPYFLNAFGRLSEAAAGNAGQRAQSQAWLDEQIRNGIRANDGDKITADRAQEIARHTIPLVDASQGVSNVARQYGKSLEILIAVTGLVLLIACANLANFLLARAVARQREIATRLALGSSRTRIVRQSLMETLLLSLAGGALGLGIAFTATRALIAFVARGKGDTALNPIPDGRVLLFTLGVSLATALLFGLAPALAAARTGAAASLSSNSRTAQGAGGRAARFWPKALVTAQVMLALLLLVGAGLFLRTLRNLQNQDFGFEQSTLLLGEIDERLAGYQPHQAQTINVQLVERLSAIPGVKSAALALSAPISFGNWSSSLSVPGYTPAPKEERNAFLNRVTGKYFATTGISIVQGRAIADTDTATSMKVAVVNEAVVRHFFPKGDAVGRMVSPDIGSVKGPWQIVGVARDTKSGDPRAESAHMMVYLPLKQIPLMEKGPDGADQESQNAFVSTVLVRTSAKPEQTIADLRAAVAAVDPNLPLLEVRTIREHLDLFMSQQELIGSLTAIFAGLALVLAAIGLYGVMSYNVVRRTNEIGVRLALGAQGRMILWMVLRESLVLLAVGLGLGLPLAFALTRLVREQLFGVTAVDPVTFVGAVVVVGGMTLVAAWWPARSAARVDPMTALRCD